MPARCCATCRTRGPWCRRRRAQGRLPWPALRPARDRSRPGRGPITSRHVSDAAERLAARAPGQGLRAAGYPPDTREGPGNGLRPALRSPAAAARDQSQGPGGPWPVASPPRAPPLAGQALGCAGGCDPAGRPTRSRGRLAGLPCESSEPERLAREPRPVAPGLQSVSLRDARSRRARSFLTVLADGSAPLCCLHRGPCVACTKGRVLPAPRAACCLHRGPRVACTEGRVLPAPRAACCRHEGAQIACTAHCSFPAVLWASLGHLLCRPSCHYG